MIILASSSPRRRELLIQAGYVFRVVAPDAQVECGICSRRGPAEFVAEMAYRKAADVRGKVSSGTILACDTVVECGGEILGKPADRAQADAMLRALRGREHRVFSGICLWHVLEPATSDMSFAVDPAAEVAFLEEPRVRVALTTLKMDLLTDAEIEEYLESDAWQGKAGAFGYQDRLGWVHVQSGSETNVVGLPMELLGEMLASLSG
jgi:septum formation protein